MGLLPQVVFSPFAGALVDRWDRRKVLAVSDGVIALATVVLGVLYRLGVVQVSHVYVLLFVRSLGAAFQWPAMQATTPLMVPNTYLSRVAGLNQTLNGVNNIATPPLAALLLQALPVEAVLAIDVATAALAIAPLLVIPVPQPARSAEAVEGGGLRSVWDDLLAGLRFVRGWRGLVIILAMAAMINLLLNPGFALLPILATEHFGGAALQLAWLQSAWGVGMVFGAITLSVKGGWKSRIRTAMLALVVQGVGIAVVGWTPARALWLALAALGVSGFMNPVVNGLFFALLQTVVPNEMQGRVFTLAMSASAAMSPLGLSIAGPVADRLGVRIWFVVGGLATSLMGATMLRVPDVMRIEEQGAALEGAVHEA